MKYLFPFDLQKASLFTVAIALIALVLVFMSGCGSTMETSITQDIDQENGGYWVSTPISGTTKFESSEKTRIEASEDLLALDDGTKARIFNLPSGNSIDLTLERTTTTIAPDQFDLETTGSMRVLRIDDMNLSAMNQSQLNNMGMLITFPAAEKGDIDPETINIMRVGSIIDQGKIIQNSIRFLPANIDNDGNITASDIYFSDALLEFTQKNMRASNTNEIALLNDLPADNIVQPIGTTRSGTNDANGPVEIKYCLISFQNSINWNRQPALVRMIPDAMAADKRLPIDKVSPEEKAQEQKKPVQNVIVFAHGRNEAEKAGDASLSQIGAPWFYSYKRDVWTYMYDEFISSHEEMLDCTVFFEWIYPTFRPILSPVMGETDKVTLDQDFERCLHEALKSQLIMILISI